MTADLTGRPLWPARGYFRGNVARALRGDRVEAPEQTRGLVGPQDRGDGDEAIVAIAASNVALLGRAAG